MNDSAIQSSLQQSIASVRDELTVQPRPQTQQQKLEQFEVFTPAYWSYAERSGGTYTSTVDWTAQFTDPSVTYYTCRIPSGSCYIHGADNLVGRMWDIRFDASNAFSVDVMIYMYNLSGSPRLQIQDNGNITEYTTNGNHVLTLNFKVGRNRLSVIANTGTMGFEFKGYIIDGFFTKFIEPGADALGRVSHGGSGGGVGTGDVGAGGGGGAP